MLMTIASFLLVGAQKLPAFLKTHETGCEGFSATNTPIGLKRAISSFTNVSFCSNVETSVNQCFKFQCLATNSACSGCRVFTAYPGGGGL